MRSHPSKWGRLGCWRHQKRPGCKGQSSGSDRGSCTEEGSRPDHLGCTEQDNSHSYQCNRADSHTEAGGQEGSSREGCCTAERRKAERHKPGCCKPGCCKQENHRHWEDSSRCGSPAGSGSPMASSAKDNAGCDDEWETDRQ
jgi:hypothetical protein